jgi:hypothetical protein
MTASRPPLEHADLDLADPQSRQGNAEHVLFLALTKSLVPWHSFHSQNALRLPMWLAEIVIVRFDTHRY